MDVKRKILHEISSSRIHIVEMSSAAVSGRRNAKFVLHEIFPDDTQWQDNGLSWSREYTEQNMHSVEGMSVTVEFADEKKREPFGHGFTGTNAETGVPEFNNAVMVGFTHTPRIETLKVNGRQITALTAEASLDQHRYPLFIDWLFNEINSGNTINGSVEIVGVGEGNQIQYEAGEWTETGRIPTHFTYSGYAILGIRPADSSAITLELNSRTETKLDSVKKRIRKLESGKKSQPQEYNSKEKENQNMDEKVLAILTEIKTLVTNGVEINELQVALNESQATVEQLKTLLEQTKADYERIHSELDINWRKVKELEETIAKQEIEAAIGELNAALAQFTDEQTKVAQKEIDAFKAEPNTAEINSIVAAIKIAIADKAIENAKIVSEQNSFNRPSHSMDIFGAMDEPLPTGSAASIY